MSRSTGKLADPAWRRKRAKKAGEARTTIDYHVSRIVDRAPELTAEQRDRLAVILHTSRTVEQPLDAA